MTSKDEMRSEMRRVRRGLTDHAARSDALCRRVVALDEIGRARRLMAFVGVGGEPDTTELIERCRELGIEIVLPRVSGETLQPVLVTAQSRLVAGAFGIPEPEGQPIDGATIDVVVVPGLAFTADGARLGQGGGHFDRFLAEMPSTGFVVGVCFSEQLVDELPVEAHDRHVDVVVTDRETCRKPDQMSSS